jgi:hypothetical protein
MSSGSDLSKGMGGGLATASNVVPFPCRLSQGKRADLCSGQSFDLLRFYADFPDRWMAFLRAQFPHPVAVAFHFGVSERAAEKWWQGVGGPRGDKLAVALVTVPGAADVLLRAA